MSKVMFAVAPVLVIAAMVACQDDAFRDTCNTLENGRPAPVEDPVTGDPRFSDNGNGTVTDTESGLVWQQDWIGEQSLEQAIAYCDGLELAGAEWALPDLDQLRSLVFGCKATATGGDCKATLKCLADCAECIAFCETCETGCDRCAACKSCNTDCYDGTCYGCSTCVGPGRYGCYMDAAFRKPCGYYVSSSLYIDYDVTTYEPIPNVWGVNFTDANVFLHLVQGVNMGSGRPIPNLFDVRCVRK
jgi:hypothetical protein